MGIPSSMLRAGNRVRALAKANPETRRHRKHLTSPTLFDATLRRQSGGHYCVGRQVALLEALFIVWNRN